MSSTLHHLIVRELGLLLEPLIAAAGSPRRRRQLFEAVGWQLEAIPGLSLDKLDLAITQTIQAYDSVAALAERESGDDFETLVKVLESVDKVWQAIETLQNISDRLDVPEIEGLRHVGQELINFLGTRYLSVHHPALYELATLLTLVRLREIEEGVVFGNPPTLLRVPHARPELRLDRIVPLLRDPIGLLRAEHIGENGLRTVEDAQRAADSIFPHLGGLFATLGVPAYYRVVMQPDPGPDLGPLGNELAPGILAIFLPTYEATDTIETGGRLTLALSPADRGDLGLVIVPTLQHRYSNDFDDWNLTLQFEQEAVAFAVGPRGFTVLAGQDVANVKATMLVATVAGNEEVTEDSSVVRQPALTIGRAAGTRLEVGRAHVSVFCDLDAQDQDYGFLASVNRAALVIAAGDGDGFLQKILPADPIRTEFDLAIGWSRRKGLHLGGNASLEVTFPVHRTLLGVVTVDSICASIETEDDGLNAVLAATGSVKLGPFVASLDRLGIRAEVSFVERGNLGPLALDKLKFKPPSGVGLSIDAGPIVGGGYLSFDAAKQEYAGILQLEFQEAITLTAIGLLTTKMPDGSKGFSLLLIISAEDFTPIQLGYGFTLNGVGGLVGVNRTVVVDVLRAGLKNGTLDSVLFPEDPVRNAPQIISNLGAVFPPAEGRYVFGPMAIIGWGTPTMVTIELGIVLEVPAPVRLVIIGQVRACLPDPLTPLITLQMDALGVIDFDKGDASVDATLYDSRLMQYVLTGDMALRANWGASPTFVLAVGGLHPRFQPPPAFPTLDRIAVSLATGDNPRLRLETYLALTSNTAQIGARLELYAKEGGFTIEGAVGFDALFQFEPFQFVADVGGRVVVRRGRHKITSVGLDMTLTGPKPWHAWGKAKFEVLSIKHSVRFDARYGQQDELPPPVAVDVMKRLRDAAGDARNWSGQLPQNGHPLVSVRRSPVESRTTSASTVLLVHPESELVFRQRVVPLNLTISRFGNATPSGARFFALREVKVNARAVKPAPVTEHFAPAQFFEMSDDEKLSRPSFEPLEAGIRLGTNITHGDQPVWMPIEYETIVVDPKKADPDAPPADYPLPAKDLPALAQLGAAGRAAIRRTGRAKYRAVGPRIAVSDDVYVVATTDTLGKESIPGLDEGAVSFTTAAEALRSFLAAHPERRGSLQIVRDTRG